MTNGMKQGLFFYSVVMCIVGAMFAPLGWVDDSPGWWFGFALGFTVTVGGGLLAAGIVGLVIWADRKWPL
jgi:hypothetical protein